MVWRITLVDKPKTPDEDAENTQDGDEGSDLVPSRWDLLRQSLRNKIKPLLKEVVFDFKENFKPQILTTVLAFILFCIPFGLGVWQTQRLEWKTNLISQIEEQKNKEPYDFTALNPFQDWEALNYRKAFTAGDFMFLHSIKIKPRTFDGKVGYHLLTPLRLDDGGIVIVNRGWVPEGINITEEYWNAEDVTVSGALHQSKKPNSFTPDNSPKNDEWYWPDLNLIAKEIGVDRVAPTILHQDNIENPDAGVQYPIGGQLNITMRNTHKMYAITWFLLSFSLVIVWFFYSWKSVEILEAPTEEGSEDLDEDSF